MADIAVGFGSLWFIVQKMRGVLARILSVGAVAGRFRARVLMVDLNAILIPKLDRVWGGN